MRAIAVILLLLLAGCAQKEPPAEDEPTMEAPTALMAAPLGTNATPAGPLLENQTAFHWATDAGPDLAVRFRFDAGDGQSCRLGFGRAGKSVEGARFFALIEQGDEHDWISSSGGSIVQAHAGPVDVMGSLSLGGNSAVSIATERHLADAVSVTLVGRALGTWGNSLLSHAMAFSMECPEPFAILDAHQGETAALWDPRHSDGAGIEGPYASVMAMAMGELSVPEAYGRVVLAAHQTGAGRGGVHGDGSSAAGMFVTMNFMSIDGGPSDYGFAATRVAAVSDIFVAGAWGLEDPIDLADRLDASDLDRF